MFRKDLCAVKAKYGILRLELPRHCSGRKTCRNKCIVLEDDSLKEGFLGVITTSTQQAADKPVEKSVFNASSESTSVCQTMPSKNYDRSVQAPSERNTKGQAMVRTRHNPKIAPLDRNPSTHEWRGV